MDSADRTFIACLTPPGAGAIATLAVRGADAWPIIRSLFRAHLPEQPIIGKFYLGRLGSDKNVCDQVVLAVKEEGLELHCHGGVEVVRFVEELIGAHGVRSCTWRELFREAGFPPDGLRLLALQQLLHAPTVKTAAILLDQANGALDNTLGEIIRAIRAGDHAAALQRLARLAQTQHLGRHLVEPFRLVIAGAPNVGKSSLVNAIAGFARSVVSPVAGTTRDVVSTRIALDGWPVELIDTAGFHENAGALEKEGMIRALMALAEADLRLWVVDASNPPALPPPELRFHAIVINKVDLPSWGTVLSASCPTKSVSCKTGDGVLGLVQWIGTLLGLGDELAPGEGMAFTPGLCEQILRAHEQATADNWSAVVTILCECQRV